MKRLLALALGCLGVACVAPHGAVRAQTQGQNDVVQVRPVALELRGEMTQGGWIRGQLPPGTVQAALGDAVVSFDADRRFFAAFDRDAGPKTVLTVLLENGSHLSQEIPVSPRGWNIEHVNASPTANVPSEQFMARRRPELERIAAARQVETGSQGWLQTFIWPATGRISGRFGSQRVYRGEPGSYHSGIDVAGGTGTPYVAPADGVVVLAAQSPFTLEGNLLIIDHGMGLSSAFLHSSELLVREGDAVKQGQMIGRIGATGRATGPHLHWGLVWRGFRLDPLLFTGPMP